MFHSKFRIECAQLLKVEYFPRTIGYLDRNSMKKPSGREQNSYFELPYNGNLSLEVANPNIEPGVAKTIESCQKYYKYLVDVIFGEIDTRKKV